MPPLAQPRALVPRAVSLLLALALSVLVLSAHPLAARASASLTVTATTANAVPPGAITALPGVSVTPEDTADLVVVEVRSEWGSLIITQTSGLTLGYGSWSSNGYIGFSGSIADVNAGLASLKIDTNGVPPGVFANPSIKAFEVPPGYHYSSSTGHVYRYVDDPGISWADAQTAATSATFKGKSGYLATVPNADVNNLVGSISGDANVWFGATSQDQLFDFPGRLWVWNGGQLDGDTFTTCSYFQGTCDFTDDSGKYHSWYSGQPDNAGGTKGDAGDNNPNSGEYLGLTNYQGNVGEWGDAGPGYSTADGYVMEFGDQDIGETAWTGQVSASKAVLIGTPPGPSAPTNVAAVGGNGHATVTFTEPTDSGITGYVVTTSPGGATTSCSGSPCDVTGLTNGTAYTFTVHTVTAADGDSPESSPSVAVTPAAVPGQPTVLTYDGGDGSATVTFSAPASNGGAAITGYTLTASPGSHSVTCSSSPCVLSGLTNGTSYSLTLVATNSTGDSAQVDAGTVMPATTPGAPTGVSATRGNGAATVSFTAPADDGGNSILSYTVTSAPGGLTASCPGSPCTVTGLTNGTSYEFTVVAVNEFGPSRPSAASSSITPASAPTAPVNLQVVRHSGSADLSFLAPASTGGSTITGYQVSTDGGDTWSTLTTSGSTPITATVTGLTNGTPYVIEVRAVNAIGTSPATDPTGVTPADQPDAPTGVTATRGNGRATVSFTPPADNGSPITSYTVTSSPGGLTATCSGSPCVVLGLANGTSYTFTVVATNDVGDSNDSGASNTVTPASAPTAPGAVSAVSAAGAALLSFDPPASDGGSPILGYEVSTDGGETWAPLTTSGTSPLTATVTGLTNGTEYAIQVQAVNSVDSGNPTASVSVTPATVPGTVRSVDVAITTDGVTVSWLPPASDGGSPITLYGVSAQPGGQSCLTDTTSCTFPDLPEGVTYTFTVYATNQVEGKAGTGTGEGQPSDPTLVTALPGVPQALTVTTGDRKLLLAFDPPAADGGSAIIRYQVSLDGGRTWQTVKTSGTAHRTATVTGLRNGASFKVQVRAVSAVGAGAGTATTNVTTASWFVDPVSKADRRSEVAVPKHPSRYHGKPKFTRASYRSKNGTIAYPALKLKGRQLQSGQAVNLTAYFAPHSAKLTTAGRAQVKATAKSLRYVTAITCEGYTDYTGTSKGQQKLGLRRATTVCKALKSYAKQLGSRRVVSYGGSRPVVIAKHAADRAANRRVVVLIRK